MIWEKKDKKEKVYETMRKYENKDRKKNQREMKLDTEERRLIYSYTRRHTIQLSIHQIRYEKMKMGETHK